MRLLQWFNAWLHAIVPAGTKQQEAQLPNPFFATLGS